jgi:hypothetical protein
MKMTTAQTALCCLVFKLSLSALRDASRFVEGFAEIPTTHRRNFRESRCIKFFDSTQHDKDSGRRLLTKTGHVELFRKGQ